MLAVGCTGATLILSFKEEKERITNYISGFVEDIWGQGNKVTVKTAYLRACLKIKFDYTIGTGLTHLN
ncbi:MAG: hypothetical protein PHT13_05490 [Methanosarcina sp.]|nr:hypothetical protein [Methanosarcina sp.]